MTCLDGVSVHFYPLGMGKSHHLLFQVILLHLIGSPPFSTDSAAAAVGFNVQCDDCNVIYSYIVSNQIQNSPVLFFCLSLYCAATEPSSPPPNSIWFLVAVLQQLPLLQRTWVSFFMSQRHQVVCSCWGPLCKSSTGWRVSKGLLAVIAHTTANIWQYEERSILGSAPVSPASKPPPQLDAATPPYVHSWVDVLRLASSPLPSKCDDGPYGQTVQF